MVQTSVDICNNHDNLNLLGLERKWDFKFY